MGIILVSGIKALLSAFDLIYQVIVEACGDTVHIAVSRVRIHAQ